MTVTGANHVIATTLRLSDIFGVGIAPFDAESSG
jgi:hypothetical protein